MFLLLRLDKTIEGNDEPTIDFWFNTKAQLTKNQDEAARFNNDNEVQAFIAENKITEDVKTEMVVR